ncbi:MAG TPA: FAD-binding oxidoreductase [Patescibacteria group bacterium]|nr:FAD-binding oxidoreductase [Patescibacteria group bacterium]
MPIQQFTAKLSESTIVGEEFHFLKFELLQPEHIEFVAGQYLLLNTPGALQKRQYSIASAPRLDHAFELLVEKIPNGVASGYLCGLKPGDEISFYAPAGEFVIADSVQVATTPINFVATGSGIAPLRAMILDLLRTRDSKRQIMLYWGMRFAQNLFWLDQLDELHDAFPNFSYHLVLSKATDEWKLCRGRVTDCLTIHEIAKDAEYYLCGNSHMITDVMGVLAQKGVPAEHVHHEKFI